MPEARPGLLVRSFLLVLGGIVVAAATPAWAAGFLFAEEAALLWEGELHATSAYLVEPDGDASLRPASLFDAGLLAKLQPRLRFDEYLTVGARLDVTAVAGLAGTPDGSAPPAEVAWRRLWLRWRTPLGTLELGRVPWRWGLGLFAQGGAWDPDRYGIPTGGGARDQLLWRGAPLGLASSWRMLGFLRSWAEGSRDAVDAVADGWSLGLGVERTAGAGWRGGALLRRDARAEIDHEAWWLDLYADLPLGWVRLAFEAAGRYGRTGGQPGLDLAARRWTARRNELMGWGAVLQATAAGWRSDGVSFARSGLEVGYLSGDDLAAFATDGRWSWLAADPDWRVGLLLLERLWPRRLAALQAWYADGIDAFVGDRTATTLWAQRVPDGIANLLYLQPTFSLRTEGDLRFRLSVLYARTLRPLPTLAVLDDAGTAQRVDDQLGRGRTLGWELTSHFGVPLWGRVRFVIEGAVAFPGDAFTGADGAKAPTAVALEPRLTVVF